MGFWFRGQHELLMVGTRGQFSPPPRSMLVSSILREPRTLHSRKPDGIRELLSRWFPNARRLEMFGRPVTDNLFDPSEWDYFGNEVDSISLETA